MKMLTSALFLAIALASLAAVETSAILAQSTSGVLDDVSSAGTIDVIVGVRTLFVPEGQLADETAVSRQRRAMRPTRDAVVPPTLPGAPSLDPAVIAGTTVSLSWVPGVGGVP